MIVECGTNHRALFSTAESGVTCLDRSGLYAQENVSSVGRMEIELCDERTKDNSVLGRRVKWGV
jgi:hypothetical protein